MIFLRKTEAATEISRLLDQAKLANDPKVYRDGAVYEQIRKDFFGKCYLCEDDEVTSIQIEHFEPHRGDLSRKYAWRNLYFSCGHCNNLKGDRYWPLVDCTDPAALVWQSIEIRFIPFPRTAVEIEIHPVPGHEAECLNTKRLLEAALGNKAPTPMKRDEASALRQKMLRAHDRLHTAIARQDVEEVRRVIDQRAPFAGMCRWVLKRDFPRLFEQHASDALTAR